MTELKQYMVENKRIKVAQWNKEREETTVSLLQMKNLINQWLLKELNQERVELIQKVTYGNLITLKTESVLQSKYEVNWII